MDKELCANVLTFLCEHPVYSKYSDIFKNLQFDENQLVYEKYLHVQPPIPGLILNDSDTAKNIFSMKYNEAYNQKYNINPYDNSSEDELDDNS
jgi:hypothetical protein